MRLIDADALKSGFNSDNFRGFVIQRVIDMAQTIEPVRGEKLDIPEEDFFEAQMCKQCSRCRGYLAHDDIFCSKCGAKLNETKSQALGNLR